MAEALYQLWIRFFRNWIIVLPKICVQNKFFLQISVWNRACVKLTDNTYCSKWSYYKRSFVRDMLLIPLIKTALRGQWWRILTKYFGSVFNASTRRVHSSECFRHCFWYLIFAWPYSNTHKGKKVNLFMWYLETGDSGVWNNHEIIVIVKPSLNQPR